VAVQFEEILVQAERFARVGLSLFFTYFVAVWIAAIWWTFQDIRSRTNDFFLVLAATLLVVVFSFPGLLIYFLLRPHRTLADLFNEALEEETLTRSVSDGLCPACQRVIETDFVFCPWCQARLRQFCPHCERPMQLRWRICPYCGRSPTAPDTPTEPTRQLVQS
jgi:RNA polymerase subunit RPABC4/transcription elongation factor Spt4